MEAHLGTVKGGAPMPLVQFKQTSELKRAPSEILLWPSVRDHIKGPIQIEELCSNIFKDLGIIDYQTLLSQCRQEGHLPDNEQPTDVRITDKTFKFVTSATAFSFSIKDYTRYETACKGIFVILKILADHSLFSDSIMTPAFFPIYDNGKVIYYVIRKVRPGNSSYETFDKNFDKFEDCFKHRAKNGQLIFMFRYEDPIKYVKTEKVHFDLADLDLKDS